MRPCSRGYCTGPSNVEASGRIPGYESIRGQRRGDRPGAGRPGAFESPDNVSAAHFQGKRSESRMNTDDEAQIHKQKMQALKEEQARKVAEKTTDRGVIIVNTGDGKGKSTAGFGLALRAAGNGQRVGVVQFIKGTWKTGEAEAFKRFPEIDHVVSGKGFTWNTQDKTKDIEAARE